MSVSLMVCAERECGRMLNGEVCDFVGSKAYCWEHAAPVRAFSAAQLAQIERLQADDSDEGI